MISPGGTGRPRASSYPEMGFVEASMRQPDFTLHFLRHVSAENVPEAGKVLANVTAFSVAPP